MNKPIAWRSSLSPFWLLCSLCFAVALAVFAPSTATAAPTEEQKRQAKEHYERAKRLHEVGRYAEAIEEYQKLYLLVDDPPTLYNIAQCYRLMDKPEEAVRFYRTFLRRAPTTDRREQVEKTIAELERTIEERQRAGTLAPPAPTTPAPTTPAPVTPPAPAPPLATAPPPMGPPSALPPPSPGTTVGVTETVPPPPRKSRVLPYTLIGVGGGLVLTALIAGGVAESKEKDVEKAAKNGAPFDPSLESSGRAANVVAIVSALAGVAAAATGAILLIGSGSGDAAAADAPKTARATFFPLAGAGLAGAGARVTF